MRAGVRLLTLASSSTKRRLLRRLSERPVAFGPGREARITAVGEDMLFVAFVAERWLQAAPHGPLDLNGGEAEAALAALAEGWSSTLVHALAREPLTLPELERAVDHIDGRGLERRLLAMRHAGLVTVRPDDGAAGLFTPTDWLREGIAPLSAAARVERREPRDPMEPIDELDVEAAFLLTLPLLELPTDIAGPCRLAVEIGPEARPDGLAGVTAHVEDGRVISCATRLEETTGTWAIASAGNWLDTLIEPDAKRVRTGGDRLLATTLLGCLRNTLFGIPVKEAR